jgi:hypothetical protein
MARRVGTVGYCHHKPSAERAGERAFALFERRPRQSLTA